MPTIPSGGLSMFIHIFILLVGNFLQWLSRHGFNSRRAHPFSGIFTGKERDQLWRRVMSWSMAGVIFLVLFISTTISVINNAEQNLHFSIPDFHKENFSPYTAPMNLDGMAILIHDQLLKKERELFGEKAPASSLFV